MYSDTITVFNHYKSRTAGDLWFPTVINNVDVNVDRAKIVATQGSENSDSAAIHIKYTRNAAGNIMVGGKKYLTPKEWAKVLTDDLGNYITFDSGLTFSVIYVGEWESTDAISDEDYTEGFYSYIKATYDNVFAITSASGAYGLIPHFEIMAK